MGTSSMERMDQQAASQTKTSRKADNLLLPQYIAVSDKERCGKIWLSLLEEILQNQKKNLFL